MQSNYDQVYAAWQSDPEGFGSMLRKGSIGSSLRTGFSPPGMVSTAAGLQVPRPILATIVSTGMSLPGAMPTPQSSSTAR